MRRFALAAGVVLVLAGCGTTVPLSASGGGTAVGGAALAGPSPQAGAQPDSVASGGTVSALGGDTQVSSSGATPGPSKGGGQVVPGSTGSDSPATSLTANPTQANGRPADVPGVTASTVKLGVEYISTASLAAFANAAGVKAVGQVDELAAYQAVVAAVNRAGGVAGGRKLVIVARQRSAAESTDQAAQATCAAFTQDNRVLAANTALVEDSPIVDCLAQHGVLSIGAGYPEAGSQGDFKRFGGRYVAPGTADTISASKAYVDSLVQQHFLTPSSTIGLLWFGFNDLAAARAEGLLPALKAHGLSVKSDFEATYDGNPASLGSVATEMQSAVLKFRTAGVDRVLTLDEQGTLEYLFMTNAQQQGYHPLYGLASWSDTEFLRANAPAAQLQGSTGIGWLPAYDLSVSQQPSDASRQRCNAVMKAANMPPVQAQTDALIEYGACDTVFYLADLLNRARELTPAGLAAAASALGERPSYAGFGNSYSADKFWGASTYRNLAYGADCGCFNYSGPYGSFN